MTLTILRVGVFIFVVGFFSYFWSHSTVLASFICSIGFLLFIIGFIGWSMEAAGDISFS